MKKLNISTLISFIFLLCMTLIWIFPLAWAFFSSFKDEIDIQSYGFSMLPVHWVITNYQDLLFDNSSTPVAKWFMNSMIISVTQTVLVLVVVSMAAYGYTRLRFKGRDWLFSLLLASMMFPAVVNLIPLYKIIDTLGWVNTYWAAIVPGAAAVFNVFLVRQFMIGIPLELDESARIDGANDFQIYTKVTLPLIKPVLTVVALFTFTSSWNDFLWPSIVFNDIDRMPITPGLQLLQGMYVTDIGHAMSAALIAIVPTFILYLFTQRYFLQSMSLTSGVKG
ncbi:MULTISPECIES: carbohydrate ABC transporter permease [Fictibacillus]|uniref:ABC transporter permease n=1 Tax=Fictibacillus enclensis TaxID=1017270 RepID=A0A0V8JBV5_9BACL|nr:carbohydrate ABC transporter permease [Fictibacillus enclensis]KSU84526.1 ABC transporter permease [Fictibacillus enclensis]RXY99837.1 carbohydrate ABC transporter permease [Fictibacillus sp. S7]SCB80983.1 multiple sugar transport system permease protein [Fictibacillus enclensis]